MDTGYYMGPERRNVASRGPDFGAIAVGTFAIIGFTMLLLSLGGALNVNVPGDAADGAIATAFSTWAVFSAIVGTILGCIVGGLLCARRTVSSAFGHALAACAGAVAIGVLLGSLGVPGLVGSAMTFAANDIGTAAATSIGWDGWATFVALIGSFLVAGFGWMAGLALKPRAGKETRIEQHHVVRQHRTVSVPQSRVPQSDELETHSRS